MKYLMCEHYVSLGSQDSPRNLQRVCEHGKMFGMRDVINGKTRGGTRAEYLTTSPLLLHSFPGGFSGKEGREGEKEGSEKSERSPRFFFAE